MRSTRFVATAATFFVLTTPAVADKGGGHEGDTSPGNSGEHKVVICHKRGPNPPITITVDEHSTLPAHLRHGDKLGPCPTVVTPPGDDDNGTPPTPPGDTPPTSTDGTPTPAPTPPAPGVTETPTTPAEVPVAKPAPQEPVAPDATPPVAKKHHARPQTVARVHKQQAALAVRTQQARAEQELPHTGFPAGLIAVIGVAGIAGGVALRRKPV